MPKIVVEVPDNCMSCMFRYKHKKAFRYCLIFQEHLEDMKGAGKSVNGLARCRQCKSAELKVEK